MNIISRKSRLRITLSRYSMTVIIIEQETILTVAVDMLFKEAK